MSTLLYQDLTFSIIGAAMEVHRILGPGFLEPVYQKALERELSLLKIPFQPQAKLEVSYKSEVVGEYRADFLVDEKVIIEIKSTSKLSGIDEAQLINYLKSTGLRVGLLLNFGAPSLEHKRRII